MIWRRVAVGALVLGLVAALVVVLWPEAEEPVEPTVTLAQPSSEPSTEATASEEPSPSPSVVVPTPDTTGRDFDRIFREIVAFRDWLYANPNPELIDLIYSSECPCYDEAKAELRDLRRADLRFDDDGFEIESVDLSEDLGQVVRLRVVMERTPQVIVDKDGTVVDTSEGVAPAAFSVALIPAAGERWLVRTITPLGPQ